MTRGDISHNLTSKSITQTTTTRQRKKKQTAPHFNFASLCDNTSDFDISSAFFTDYVYILHINERTRTIANFNPKPSQNPKFCGQGLAQEC